MLGKYFITFEMWMLRYWGCQALGTFLCVYAAETFADWQGRGSSPLGMQSSGLHGVACVSQGLFDGFFSFQDLPGDHFYKFVCTFRSCFFFSGLQAV